MGANCGGWEIVKGERGEYLTTNGGETVAADYKTNDGISVLLLYN
jgi:hypothetical protein